MQLLEEAMRLLKEVKVDRAADRWTHAPRPTAARAPSAHRCDRVQAAGPALPERVRGAGEGQDVKRKKITIDDSFKLMAVFLQKFLEDNLFQFHGMGANLLRKRRDLAFMTLTITPVVFRTTPG